MRHQIQTVGGDGLYLVCSWRISYRPRLLGILSIVQIVLVPGGAGDLRLAGAEGRRPGNTSRDFMRTLLRDVSMPPPYFADIPCHDPKTNEDFVYVKLPFLLVHELLCMMVSRDNGLLAKAAGAMGRHVGE